jgi:hypothetical protein
LHDRTKEICFVRTHNVANPFTSFTHKPPEACLFRGHRKTPNIALRSPLRSKPSLTQSANMRQTCIFSGSSHPSLVGDICERLGQKQADVDLRKFANGETSVEISQSP